MESGQTKPIYYYGASKWILFWHFFAFLCALAAFILTIIGVLHWVIWWWAAFYGMELYCVYFISLKYGNRNKKIPITIDDVPEYAQKEKKFSQTQRILCILTGLFNLYPFLALFLSYKSLESFGLSSYDSAGFIFHTMVVIFGFSFLLVGLFYKFPLYQPEGSRKFDAMKIYGLDTEILDNRKGILVNRNTETLVLGFPSFEEAFSLRDLKSYKMRLRRGSTEYVPKRTVVKQVTESRVNPGSLGFRAGLGKAMFGNTGAIIGAMTTPTTSTTRTYSYEVGGYNVSTSDEYTFTLKWYNPKQRDTIIMTTNDKAAQELEALFKAYTEKNVI